MLDKKTISDIVKDETARIMILRMLWLKDLILISPISSPNRISFRNDIANHNFLSRMKSFTTMRDN